MTNFIVKFYNSFKTYNYKKQKIIKLNIHSYQKNKKTNPMLLKQHTAPSIICII